MSKQIYIMLFFALILIAILIFRTLMLPLFIITDTDTPYFGCFSSNTTINSINIKNKRCFSFSGTIKVISVISDKKDEDNDFFLSYVLEPKRIDLKNSIVDYAIENHHFSPKKNQIEKYWKPIGDVQIKITKEENSDKLIYKSQLLNGDNNIEVLIPW